MSKDVARPSTPANLIRNPTGSSAGLNNLNNQLNNASPRRTTRQSVPRESVFSQLKSPLSPGVDTSSDHLNIFPMMMHEDTDEPEMAINKLLSKIEKGDTIDNDQLKHTLQKCLITMSHYKLQNQILKFNSNETLKRSEIENELIQRQVDQLSNYLKSPFKPKEECDEVLSYTMESSIPQRALQFNKRLKLTKVTKPSSKLKLKLVEKHPNNSTHNSNNIIQNNDNIKNNSEFNQCIKVFHLEKTN